MKVTIFGTGYVGLVQAAVFADVGHEICCVDVDEEKITNLKNGIVPIFEPGLEDLIAENFQEGRLHFTTDARQGVDFGNILFISVGTPPGEDGSADLQHVLAVAATIAEHMNADKVVVDKSTVPVGTADKVRETIREGLAKRGADFNVDVVSNPEFLKEGAAISDCQRPDRIIIGTDSEKAIAVMRELYQPFNRNHNKFIVMDARSAEMTKYAANCMLATKISFMNEMANIAEKVGADIELVRQGIGSDPRIGFQFIYPGCGYGGSCFPKDVKALIHAAGLNSYQPEILQAVEAVNARQKRKLFDYISHYYESGLQGKTFAIWGLSFKPNTDDVREASSRVLMEQLWEAGATVRAFDPEAMDEIGKAYGNEAKLTLAATKEEALAGADALVICTEWQNFRAPDFDLIRRQLKDKVIFDGRNMYEPALMKAKGLTYFSIGRRAG
jgi:UDPglucose 6-dehydrogenase